MKRYAFAGASGRARYMFATPLFTELKEYAELVGVYDVSSARARLISMECGNIPVYDSFERMLDETRPDVVIVTTVDRFHHEYIIKALEAGCDVITEKPMTIDAQKCKAILDAERRTGKRVTVTFNYRFIPYVTKIKELLKDGILGEILSVDFEWLLDTRHGADYFRRWHRYMENSGGLLVHKSTHHFDLVNWWLNEEPEEVYAFGTRRFYGPVREKRGERCLTCAYKKECDFYWDISKDEFASEMYLNAEADCGYIRDKCVFGEDIDIYDTMSVNVKYSRGALLNYSLIAHSPYEGWRAAINGTKGRIEAEEFHSGQRAEGKIQEIRFFDRRGDVVKYFIKKAEGGHGGGDERLRRMIFVGDIPDPLGHQATSWDGAMSILVGAAANISISEKRPVNVRELIK
ncbi:MAG TPA: Gfo/Idh/MocA family oxidoreductase [Clostridiaceae bacterium]|nr:Gfo/Idh/MocA family oxidoreductase [Clostridiaceae bacterium]